MTNPPLTTTNKPLPFGDLSPLEFERLCLWLVEREGYLRPRHLGQSGSEQGRDVVAYKRTDAGEELWYFQCKRYTEINAGTLKKEVDKYDKLSTEHPGMLPVGIVFVISADVPARVSDPVGKYCQERGYAYEFWARNELDMRVKRHPAIVEEFFTAGRVSLATALHQLPPPPRDFTGRVEEMTELMSKVEQGGVTISGLHGLGGMGKTVLALKLAEQLMPRYPDAQFYIDLKGHDTSKQPLSTSDALAHVIRAYYPTNKLPDNEAELHGLYQSVLHGQRALLLLDNARDAAQVAPLIPPTSCVLIVTSRKHFKMPGQFLKNIDKLSPAESCDLLLAIEPRIGEQANAIAKLCGYLPLALRLAASALAERADLNVMDYVRRLTDTQQRLKLLDEVKTSLNLSYDLLSAELQQRWRTLAVFPATFDAAAAAAVWEIGLDAAQDTLGELIKYSLVNWNDTIARYSLHDLARLFADSHLGEKERYVSQGWHALYYLHLLSRLDKLYLQGGEAAISALSLFDAEWTNIQHGQLWAALHVADDISVAGLCSDYSKVGGHLYDLRLHPREQIKWFEQGLSAAQELNDRTTEAVILGRLGLAYWQLGEIQQAIEFHEQNLVIAREVGNRCSEGNALTNLGLIYFDLGEFHQAIKFSEQHLAIAREIGDRSGEATALGSVGNAYMRLSEIRRAIECYEKALEIDREIGDRRGEGNRLANLGLVYADLGAPRGAIEFLEQALVIMHEIGDQRSEGTIYYNMGCLFNMLGENVQAIACAEDALRIFDQLEDPAAFKLREQLGKWRWQARISWVYNLLQRGGSGV